MKAEATSTLLPSPIGTKHIPEIQKLFPEFKNTSQNPKHDPESKKRFGFWEVFWILGCVLGFWDAV